MEEGNVFLKFLDYGALGLCAIMFILTARNLSKEQSKEAADVQIIGTIKYSLRIYALLVVAFVLAEFLAPIFISNNGPTGGSDISMESALEFLEKESDDKYHMSRNGTNNSVMEITAVSKNADSSIFQRVLGPLIVEPQELTSSQSAQDPKRWDVNLNQTSIGYIDLAHNAGSRKPFHIDEETKSKKPYYFKEKYQVKPLDLWFKIDSVHTDHEYTYKYYVLFGEGASADKVVFSDEPHVLNKTRNGEIQLLDNPVIHARNSNWQNDFIIGMGVGNPMLASDQNAYGKLDLLNMWAVAIDLH